MESNDTIDRAAHRNPKKKQTKKGKTPRLIGCRPLAATNQESSFPFSSNGLALVARATIQQIDNGQRKKDEVLRRRPSRSPEFHGKKGSNGRSKSIESFQRLTVRNNTEVLRRKLCPTDCVTQAGSPRTYVNVMDDDVMDYVIRYVTLRRSR